MNYKGSTEREKEKKLLRKERTRLRTLSEHVVFQRLLGLGKDDVEGLCMLLGLESLKELC
jgi:DnaJ homolog subfamily C member 2